MLLIRLLHNILKVPLGNKLKSLGTALNNKDYGSGPNIGPGQGAGIKDGNSYQAINSYGNGGIGPLNQGVGNGHQNIGPNNGPDGGNQNYRPFDQGAGFNSAGMNNNEYGSDINLGAAYGAG